MTGNRGDWKFPWGSDRLLAMTVIGARAPPTLKIRAREACHGAGRQYLSPAPAGNRRGWRMAHGTVTGPDAQRASAALGPAGGPGGWGGAVIRTNDGPTDGPADGPAGGWQERLMAGLDAAALGETHRRFMGKVPPPRPSPCEPRRQAAGGRAGGRGGRAGGRVRGACRAGRGEGAPGGNAGAGRLRAG